MFRLFQRLRAAFLFGSVHPYIDQKPPWTSDDARELSRFLNNTTTGQRWRSRMWREVQQGAFRAIQEKEYSAYQSGYASGLRGLMAVNDSMLFVQEEVKRDDPKGSDLPPDIRALVGLGDAEPVHPIKTS